MKTEWKIAVCTAVLWLAGTSGLPVYAEENHAHDEHEHHDHDEHEENSTVINPYETERAGIRLAQVALAPIDEHITLTGRIGQNRNTTVSVPARFPAIVKDMHVTWGEKVKAGQVLATLESRSNPTRYDIVAPVDGVILERNASHGDIVSDEAVFVIADLTDVWAEFHVFPRDLPRVQEELHVHVKALESNQETTAPITTVMPTADAFSQTVIAVVTLPNKDRTWKPGMTVEGDVHLAGQGEEGLVVTQTAIQRMEGKSVVFVKEGDRFETRPVVLGRRDDMYVEVLEGLNEGDTYVSEGSFIIKADLGKSQTGHDHAH